MVRGMIMISFVLVDPLVLLLFEKKQKQNFCMQIFILLNFLKSNYFYDELGSYK